MRRDFSYAIRLFRRSPAFTAIAILCLALGIGATTAVFTVVDAVVFRPLPYPQSERLVRIYTEFTDFPGGGLRRFPVSPPEFVELRDTLRNFDRMASWVTNGVNLGTAAEPVRVTATYVSGTLFDALSARPELGRPITPADDQSGAPLTIVLSHGLWKRAYGGEPGLLGREVKVNGLPATVVGIMPEGFQFPPGEVDVTEAWIPERFSADDLKQRSSHYLSVAGRLRSGVSLEQGKAEINATVQAWGARNSHKFHTLNPAHHPIVSYDMHDEVVRAVRPAMIVVLCAVAFVLLIACVNVANLLLARAEARQKEISVRAAMGAGAMALVRQFLVEGLILSSVGTLLGLAVAAAGVRLLLRAGTGMIPRSAEVSMDWRVLGFSAVVMVVAAIGFGLAPLAQALARTTHESLKSASGRTSATRAAAYLRQGLVVAELSLALVLLVCTGLMVKAFWRLQSVDAGLRPDHVLTLRIALPESQYNGNAARSFFTRLEQAAAALPGVQFATVATGLPPERPLNANDTDIENFVPRPGGPMQNVDYWQTTGSHFVETVGARVLEGRALDERDGDGAAPSVMINQTMAKTFWPGQSAVGKRVRPGGPKAPWFTVVGVLADIKNAGTDKPTGTELFFPYKQLGEFAPQDMYVLVRTADDPVSQTGALRREIRALDPSVPVSEVKTMEDLVAESHSKPRFLSVLLTFFTAIALALAVIGVYGVISYSVARRTNEFGVRMALGADSPTILRSVVRQALVLGLAGAAAGLVGALLAAEAAAVAPLRRRDIRCRDLRRHVRSPALHHRARELGARTPRHQGQSGGGPALRVSQRSPCALSQEISAAGSSLMIASTCAAASFSQSWGRLAVHGTTCSRASWAAFTLSGVTGRQSGDTMVAPASFAITT